MNTKTYEQKALEFAEKYGIIEYHIQNNTMIYYSSFPFEQRTYKTIINLDTMLTEYRKPLKNYYKPYKKIGGKYQANYKS